MVTGLAIGAGRSCKRWSFDFDGAHGIAETVDCQRERTVQAIPALLVGSAAVLAGGTFIGDGVGTRTALGDVRLSAAPTRDGGFVSISGRF